MNPLVNRFARVKIYLHRVSGYMGLINFGLLSYLALSNWYGDVIKPGLWTIPFVLTILAILAFVGWCEDRLGVLREEQRTYFSRVPQMDDAIGLLKSIRFRQKMYQNQMDYAIGQVHSLSRQVNELKKGESNAG
jgi:hypothetical protein